MHNFKGGDLIRRIGTSFRNVLVNGTYVVADDTGDLSVKLVGFDGSYTAEKFILVTPAAPKEPTDEELAAEYRKNYARQVEIRNLLLDRGYNIKYGPRVVLRSVLQAISITKTVTTTKEI